MLSLVNKVRMGDVMSLSFVKFALVIGLSALVSHSALAEDEQSPKDANSIIENAFEKCSQENENKGANDPIGCKCKYQSKVNSLTHLIKSGGESAFLAAVEELEKCK